MTAERSLTDYEQEILNHVEDSGVHVTTVSDDPAFTYSAGFEQSYDRAEAIVFGLGYGVMASMINRLGDHYRDGLAPEDGLRVGGILNNFKVILRTIPSDHIDREYFNSAMWLQNRAGGELRRAVQIVWPCDQTGLFPWEAGCPPDVIQLQTPLFDTSSQ